MIEVAHRFLGPPDEIVATWHAFDADAGRCQLDEAPKAGAVADQDLGGEPAAERVADEMDPVEPHLLDEVEIEHRQVRYRMDPRRVVGAAKAGMLGHQHLVALRQRIEERQPLRHAARTMQEQHRGAAPCAVQLDGNVSDLELAQLRRHIVRSLSKTDRPGTSLSRINLNHLPTTAPSVRLPSQPPVHSSATSTD